MRNRIAFRNGCYRTDTNEFETFYSLSQMGAQDAIDEGACRFIDQEFVLYGDDLAYQDWYDFPTPAFQRILEHQWLPEEVSRWLYIFLGRLLHEKAYFDHWKAIPFLEGLSSSGVSEIVQLAAEFFEERDVGYLAVRNGMLVGAAHQESRYCVLAHGLREADKLDQEQFETLLAELRPRSACVAPVLLSGVAAPKAMQPLRSLVTFKFERTPPPELLDLHVLRRELPALIHKCNYAYLAAAREFGFISGCMLQALPLYFVSNQELLRRFLASNRVEVNRDKYVPMTVFSRAIDEYAEASHIKAITRWDSGVYGDVFAELKLVVEEDALPYPAEMNVACANTFIIGVDLNK